MHSGNAACRSKTLGLSGSGRGRVQALSGSRCRPRALIIEQFGAALLLFRRQFADIHRQVLADGHAALNPWPRRNSLEPTLEIFELFDVLTLSLDIHGPGI